MGSREFNAVGGELFHGLGPHQGKTKYSQLFQVTQTRTITASMADHYMKAQMQT